MGLGPELAEGRPSDQVGLAQQALIPEELWATFRNSTYTRLADILAFARRAEVNPAIIAGRWQKQNRDFRKLSRLMGHGSIHLQFPEFASTSYN
jgi:HTH-type transcriptional regulator/antitoxin HigA